MGYEGREGNGYIRVLVKFLYGTPEVQSLALLNMAGAENSIYFFSYNHVLRYEYELVRPAFFNYKMLLQL